MNKRVNVFLILAIGGLCNVVSACTDSRTNAARAEEAAGTLDESAESQPTDSVLRRLTAPGAWRLVELRGQLVVAANTSAVVPTITFARDLRVSGQSGCNTFSGSYTLGANNSLSISPLLSTRMMCPDIAIENEYTQVLGLVDHVTVDATSLTLERTGMPTLARFIATEKQ